MLIPRADSNVEGKDSDLMGERKVEGDGSKRGEKS